MEDAVDQNPVADKQRAFDSFLDSTQEARRRSEAARDYVDHKQWSSEEVAALQARKQAPIVINYIKRKVDLLKGKELEGRADPKAFPRNKEDESASEAVTEALRYVAQNADLDEVATEGFDNLIVEGYEAFIVEPKRRRKNDIEIEVNHIPWDRFYFDPHSRRQDFKDAKYLGICVWMDVEEAKETYPGKDEAIDEVINTAGAPDDTFADRPDWVNRGRKRIRVCQHYYRKKGVWYMCHFTEGVALIEERESPLKDEDGNPTCPIEAVHAYVDRENQRYGVVQGWLDIQNEINHRRSKALHYLTTRQTVYEKGAVDDPDVIREELRKADGMVEVNPGFFDKFSADALGDMSQGQVSLMQEAKSELESYGGNAAMNGTDQRELSGRAVQELQQGGSLELAPVMNAHKACMKRVYRQIWARLKQFWDKERWIRITDNEDHLEWVGLNQPVTVGEKLKEKAQEGDQETAQKAAQMFQMMQQRGDPRLQETIETKNKVAELDVDIVLDQGPDSVTLQQEQFQTLAELAKAYGAQQVPFEALLELSSIPRKKQVKDLLKGDDSEAAQMQAQLQQMAQQLQMAQQKAEVAKTEAEAERERGEVAKIQADIQKTLEEAQSKVAERNQTQWENQYLASREDVTPQVTI